MSNVMYRLHAQYSTVPGVRVPGVSVTSLFWDQVPRGDHMPVRTRAVLCLAAGSSAQLTMKFVGVRKTPLTGNSTHYEGACAIRFNPFFPCGFTPTLWLYLVCELGVLMAHLSS